jgi:Protein of unknown function (DUF3060)
MNRILGLVLILLASPARAGDDGWVMNDSNAKAKHDCARQPRVVVNASHDEIALVGACTRVILNGGDIRLTAESIEQVAINGVGNTVDLGAVGKIALTGGDNKVTWRSGRGGKGRPAVSDLGSSNSVTRAK